MCLGGGAGGGDLVGGALWPSDWGGRRVKRQEGQEAGGSRGGGRDLGETYT